MKKNSCLQFLLLILLFSLISCQSRLEAEIEAFNKQCPVSMGMVGEITSLELEDDCIVFNYHVNAGVLNFDALKKEPDFLKDNMKITFMNPNQDIKQLMELLVDEEFGLKIRMTEKNSGKTLSVSFNAKEVEELNRYDIDERDPNKLLEAYVRTYNALLPMEIEPGVVQTRAFIDTDYVVYEFSVDESLSGVSLQDFRYSEFFFEQEILRNITYDGLNAFAELCVETGRGIAYKYMFGSSDEECTIELSVSDLRDAISKSFR